MNELVFIAIVLTGLALSRVVLWRWRPDRRDGSKRRIPYVSVGVLGVAAAFFWHAGIRHSRLETKLSEVASELVGKPVTVECETPLIVGFGRYEGEVWFQNGVPESLTTLKKGACAALAGYVDGDKTAPTEEQIMGVGVLTHESMHMAGEADEARTQCAAVQRNAQTAVLLGASESSAQALARDYFRIWYPRGPRGYRTPECAPGASLDEHLALPPW